MNESIKGWCGCGAVSPSTHDQRWHEYFKNRLHPVAGKGVDVTNPVITDGEVEQPFAEEKCYKCGSQMVTYREIGANHTPSGEVVTKCSSLACRYVMKPSEPTGKGGKAVVHGRGIAI